MLTRCARRRAVPAAAREVQDASATDRAAQSIANATCSLCNVAPVRWKSMQCPEVGTRAASTHGALGRIPAKRLISFCP